MSLLVCPLSPSSSSVCSSRSAESSATLVQSNRLQLSFSRSSFVVEGSDQRWYDKQILPLSPNQILLQGCSLRNTEYIVGAVIFTGHETKVNLK